MSTDEEKSSKDTSRKLDRRSITNRTLRRFFQFYSTNTLQKVKVSLFIPLIVVVFGDLSAEIIYNDDNGLAAKYLDGNVTDLTALLSLLGVFALIVILDFIDISQKRKTRAKIAIKGMESNMDVDDISDVLDKI